MTKHEGGCLCGAVRYQVTAEPVRVTICHCHFCQRATGTAYFVEPIFQHEDFRVTAGTPKTYNHRSEGSGKHLRVHFCDTCGTKLHLSFERFPSVIGVYGGTFDNPEWFDRGPEKTKHIFLSSGLHDTIIPPGLDTFAEHSIDRDNKPVKPVVYDAPHEIGTKR
jgi:hypothetical protein